jgi:hypothetical protein
MSLNDQVFLLLNRLYQNLVLVVLLHLKLLDDVFNLESFVLLNLFSQCLQFSDNSRALSGLIDVHDFRFFSCASASAS